MALSDCAYDIYGFCETWLSDNTVSNQLFGSKYTVFRTDRSRLNSSKSSGGGVLLAVRSSLTTVPLCPPSSVASEEVWAVIKLASYDVYIGVVYIAPDKINDPHLISSHLSSLQWVSNRMSINDKLIIIGDYNLPRLHWKRSSSGMLFPDPAVSSINSLSAQLIDDYCTAGLHQINDIYNSNNRLLDLCFASHDLIHNLSVVPAPSALVKVCRHHPPLSITARSVIPPVFIDRTSSWFYSYNRADFNGMNEFLSTIDWQLMSIEDVDESVQNFSNIISYAIDQFVPKINNSSPSYPPWSNKRLKKLKSRKRSALKKYLRRRTAFSYSRYLTTNRQYKSLNKMLFTLHQRRVESDLKFKPKRFWSFINEQRKEVGLPSTMRLGDIEVSSPPEIC